MWSFYVCEVTSWRAQARTLGTPGTSLGLAGWSVEKRHAQAGALKTAAVAQLQGTRCDGMAHAISSLVQRRTPQADRRYGFQVKDTQRVGCARDLLCLVRGFLLHLLLGLARELATTRDFGYFQHRKWDAPDGQQD